MCIWCEAEGKEEIARRTVVWRVMMDVGEEEEEEGGWVEGEVG